MDDTNDILLLLLGKPPQHMCGMMAMQMQGGLGYDDLNELLKVSICIPEGHEHWQVNE